MKISVAMASYNGEKYITEQILSITRQLRTDDELIISDDGSKDRTIEIIKSLKEQDNRIILIKGPRQGIVRNFENAISHCSGKLIFLSDQDDIWIDKKVERVVAEFNKNPNISVLLHSKYNYYGDIDSAKVLSRYRGGVLNNIAKSSYWGCCMAFKMDFIEGFLPFPKGTVAHDQLIGLLGEYEKKASYLDEPLIYHRYHEGNATKKRQVSERIVFRVRLIRDFLKCEVGRTL